MFLQIILPNSSRIKRRACAMTLEAESFSGVPTLTRSSSLVFAWRLPNNVEQETTQRTGKLVLALRQLPARNGSANDRAIDPTGNSFKMIINYLGSTERPRPLRHYVRRLDYYILETKFSWSCYFFASYVCQANGVILFYVHCTL